MIESPCWSDFRELMEMADDFDLADKIEALIEGKGFILFFEKDGEVFGTGEEGRITFARMKNPDEESPKTWDKDAGFSATNLEKEVRGESSTYIIRKEDLKKIKVLDKDEVFKKLQKIADKLGDKAFKKSEPTVIKFDFAKFMNRDRDDADNFFQAKEH